MKKKTKMTTNMPRREEAIAKRRNNTAAAQLLRAFTLGYGSLNNEQAVLNSTCMASPLFLNHSLIIGWVFTPSINPDGRMDDETVFRIDPDIVSACAMLGYNAYDLLKECLHLHVEGTPMVMRYSTGLDGEEGLWDVLEMPAFLIYQVCRNAVLKKQ